MPSDRAVFSDVGKYDRARAAFRPNAPLVVDHLQELGRSERVKRIDRALFGDRYRKVMRISRTHLGEGADSPLRMYRIFGEYFAVYADYNADGHLIGLVALLPDVSQ